MGGPLASGGVMTGGRLALFLQFFSSYMAHSFVLSILHVYPFSVRCFGVILSKSTSLLNDGHSR